MNSKRHADRDSIREIMKYVPDEHGNQCRVED